jgi:hypothetical protein
LLVIPISTLSPAAFLVVPQCGASGFAVQDPLPRLRYPQGITSVAVGDLHGPGSA